MRFLKKLEKLSIGDTRVTHLPVWLGSLPSLKVLWCYGCPLVGVAVNDNTLLTFDELTRLMSSSDVSGVRPPPITTLLQDPMHQLRMAQMYFAPRTPLRDICLTNAAHRNVDLQRLPAHIQDEISRASGAEAEIPRKRARLE
eukprot:TRINITY_DN8663_c0_g1_i1.p1 TRINITY_DN8663_c0_g1~~TRINITY_DN8663_c0_g1_i1.p1  ORF type:complete len:156 (-),score=28.72 TRINITY_DN8663_c0_g1_i1:113-538(-)